MNIFAAYEDTGTLIEARTSSSTRYFVSLSGSKARNSNRHSHVTVFQARFFQKSAFLPPRPSGTWAQWHNTPSVDVTPRKIKRQTKKRLTAKKLDCYQSGDGGCSCGVAYRSHNTIAIINHLIPTATPSLPYVLLATRYAFRTHAKYVRSSHPPWGMQFLRFP